MYVEASLFLSITNKMHHDFWFHSVVSSAELKVLKNFTNCINGLVHVTEITTKFNKKKNGPKMYRRAFVSFSWEQEKICMHFHSPEIILIHFHSQRYKWENSKYDVTECQIFYFNLFNVCICMGFTSLMFFVTFIFFIAETTETYK